MGVISCDRPGCDNIMCDTNIDAGPERHGIDICNDCIDEFKRYPLARMATNDYDIHRALVTFIKSPKSPHVGGKIDDFFKRNNRRKSEFEEE